MDLYSFFERIPELLYLSRMFGSHRQLANFNYVIPQALYSSTTNFTVSHILYWFTSLTEREEPLIEDRLREAIPLFNGHKPTVVTPTNTPPVATDSRYI